MKLIKKMRKGFTLIELVVVIAVIAILSAVSVVSYIAITNKAKQSSDEQAVRQMNTILAANSVMDLKTINDVYSAFEENGLSVENYKPLFKDRYFFWDSDTNEIVYTDKDYVVIYPESRKGDTKGEHQWYSLTQTLAKVEIKSTDTVKINNVDVPVKKVTEAANSEPAKYEFAVEKPEQLYTIGEEMKQAMLGGTKPTSGQNSATSSVGGYDVYRTSNVAYINGDVKIHLANDIDLMGAAFNFCVRGNFELVGEGSNPVHITGIVNNRDFVEGSSKAQNGDTQVENYGAGLLGYISGVSTTNRATALFENVIIENAVFGCSKTKGSGLVGYASNADITFNNVSLKNCSMEVLEHSAGGLIGDVQAGNVKGTTNPSSIVNLTLKGTNKVEGSQLRIYEGEASKGAECYGAGYFIGRHVGPNLTITKDTATNGSFSQSGNSKVYGSANKMKATQTSITSGYKYWDNAESGTAFTNADL